MTVLTRGHTLGLLTKSQSMSGIGKNREDRAGRLAAVGFQRQTNDKYSEMV